MEVNIRDPNFASSRIYIGHLNDSITQDLLETKFSPYGRILGYLRSYPGYAFIQYESDMSANNAIKNEDGTFMGKLKILVKSAERGKQHKPQMPGSQDMGDDHEPMNKSEYD